MNIFRCFYVYEIWNMCAASRSFHFEVERSGPAVERDLIKLENFFNSFIYSTHSLAFLSPCTRFRQCLRRGNSSRFHNTDTTSELWINRQSEKYMAAENGNILFFIECSSTCCWRDVWFSDHFSSVWITFTPFFHSFSLIHHPTSCSSTAIWMKVREKLTKKKRSNSRRSQ